MAQINVDDDAYRILRQTKKHMRDGGIGGASMSDAIRELERGYNAARIDDDAKRILDREKEALKKIGRSGASLGDAIRSLRDGGQYSVDH